MARLVAGALTLVAALALAPSAASAVGAPVVVVTGRGWGHGVGMSQWGARGYAARGWRHRGILAHYYPGTRLAPAPATRVRVLLASGRTAARIGSKRAFRVVDARGRRVTLPAMGFRLGPKLVLRVGRGVVRLHPPVRFQPGAFPVRLDRAPYRGELVVHRRGGRLTVVNELDLELYLRGVVPWEMPHDWPLEALKAQAVVARSYALATLHPGDLYDLLPDTRDQVYGGLAAEHPESNRAISETAGGVLWWGHTIATTYYHSTSGGRTVAVWDEWPKLGHIPYLRAVFSPYETASPKYKWGPYVFSARGLARKLHAPVPRDVSVERNGSGRPAAVSVGGRRFAATRFQDALGLGSGWFTLGVLRLDPAPDAVYGGPLALSGVARDIAGAVVERREGGVWRQVGQVRPFASGRFRTTVRALGAEFRVAAHGATTAPVRVRLAPHVEVRRSAGLVSGVVRPALPRARVRIQRLAGDRWANVVSVRVDARGAFRADPLAEPGRYRAVVDPTRGFTAGASAPFSA
jgi:stage II sporulation protein D